MINYLLDNNISDVLVVNEIVFENLEVASKEHVEFCAYFGSNYE